MRYQKILTCTKNVRNKYLTESGSFTLESILIFPLIFIFLLLLLTLSLIQFQLAGQFYATSITADRTAHNWEVIDRVFSTGEYGIGAKRSNLYWRITSENIFKGIILEKKSGGKEALLRVANEVSSDGIINPKINQASDLLAKNYDTIIKLENGFFKNIKVKTIATSINLLPIEIIEETNIAVSNYSFVSEPDEFIRLINLLNRHSY